MFQVRKEEAKERAEYCRPQKFKGFSQNIWKDKYIICPRAKKVFIINTTNDRVRILVHYQHPTDWNECYYRTVLEPGTTFFPICNPEYRLHIQRTEAKKYSTLFDCFDGMGYHKCEQTERPCWIREQGMTLELVSEHTSKYKLISLRHGDVAERNHRHIICVTKKEILTLAELSTIRIWENTNQDPVVDRLGHKLEDVVPGTLIEQLCPEKVRLLLVHICRRPFLNVPKIEKYYSCKETGEIWGLEHVPKTGEQWTGTKQCGCQVHGIPVKKIISLVFRSLNQQNEIIPLETPIMKRSSNPRPFIPRAETSNDMD